MKIRQYSYFELASTIVSAAELTIRLGVEPDQLAVKGTTNARGRVCRLHSWRISDDLGGAVDEQLERLIVRLEPRPHPIDSTGKRCRCLVTHAGGAVLPRSRRGALRPRWHFERSGKQMTTPTGMASVGTDPGVSVLDCNQPRRRRVRPQP
ncbi:DUF4279 domain-containing protein [Nocardia salmonicida]|uniref:DUF4279 domain-containing protein n=1 Tax=Nocardia salmonicida TaxID=53431 RepID=UPI00342A3CBF